MSNIEKDINEFLRKEEVKQLIDIKFTALSKNGIDEYTAVIIYQENISLGKEEPQMYE